MNWMACMTVELYLRLFPLYGLVALGFLGSRLFKITTREISLILLYFLSPAIIFRGIYQSEVSPAAIALPFATFLLACCFGWAGFRLAGRWMQDGRQRMAAFSAGTGNTGFFGIPACLTLIGDDALPYVTAYMLGVVGYEIGYGYLIVRRDESGPMAALGRVVAYPGLHAAWIAIALRIAEIAPPAPVSELINHLAGGYTMLGMMVVGMGIRSVSLRSIDLRFVAFTFLARYLAWPIATAALIVVDHYAFNLIGPIAQQVMIVQAFVPLAALVTVHAAIQNVKPAEISLAVALSTIVSLLILPYAIAISQSLL